MTPDNQNLVSGSILLDATFDNPNYWLRVSVFLSSMGLSYHNCCGILGPSRRQQQSRTLKRFGIKTIFDLTERLECWDESHSMAKSMVGNLSNREEILTWSLPENVPSKLLYDYILKRQRYAYVRIDDPELQELVGSFLNFIYVSGHIIEVIRPSLIIASHAVGLTAPLVWISLTRGIPVVIPFGQNGVSWFWRPSKPDDMFDFQDRLTRNELFSLRESRRNNFQTVGDLYLDKRLDGKSIGLGVQKAYAKSGKHIDKAMIRNKFGWDESKPILGVYASSWFDYPHTYGMSNFIDFFDWVTSMQTAAENNTDCYWLFKAHPCDEWYGGLTLADFLKSPGSENIQLVPKEWDSRKLLESLDGIITYHGTVGLEATCSGKPVLVSDYGWYSDLGFVKKPENRRHFLNLLRGNWWSDMNCAENARIARSFAGSYWGRPSWQENYLLADDADQWEIYHTAPAVLRASTKELKIERAMIREWYSSKHPHYHAYKMLNSSQYIA